MRFDIDIGNFLSSIKSFNRIYRIHKIGSFPVNHVYPV